MEEHEPGKPFRTDICIFKAENQTPALKDHYEVLYKLIRRYKYLEKAFQEELKKVLDDFSDSSGNNKLLVTNCWYCCQD